MELLPKTIYGCPRTEENERQLEISYNNCNICRNFKNIRSKTHRLSKDHQKKLFERFRKIKSKIELINGDTITIHDEAWGKEDCFYCYFCDKPVQNHKVYYGITVEFLGYITHLANLQHMESVKSYLKYHNRKEKYDVFCKTKADLDSFISKVKEAKIKYLKKMEILNQKDIMQLKETEEIRKKLVQETLLISSQTSGSEISNVSPNQTSTPRLSQYKRKDNLKWNEKEKVPPWEIVKPDVGNYINSHTFPDTPIIGPTMDTLLKHVANQKKKGLPVKRLGGNLEHNKPTFGGVWNKGRRRQWKKSFFRGK